MEHFCLKFTMSHLVSTMAYAGAIPWHGLGKSLPANQSIETWAQAAGMDWRIEESPVQFIAESAGHLGSIHSFNEQKVLYRSDTAEPLSVVSNRYKVVQPMEILEFYRDLAEISGYELETAGVLKGGRKLWALARTGQSANLKGGDLVHSYVLLATSADGSLATTATPTTVRVVCNNTLGVALNGASQAVKVRHSTVFDPQAVKKELGIAVSRFDGFMYEMRMLAERKVKSHEAMSYFLKVLCEGQEYGNTSAKPAVLMNERALKTVQGLYEVRAWAQSLHRPKAQPGVWSTASPKFRGSRKTCA